MDVENRGFTIVELLVAMAEGLIVLAALYALFTVHNRHFANQEQRTEMQQNARIAMEMMTREIRMAGYNQTTQAGTKAVSRCTGITMPSNAPCAGITHASSDSISFVADINGNGDTTAEPANPNENITYDIYSSSGVQTLGRSSNGSRQPAVENVESLRFDYYDGADPGNITASLANIRRIRITIVTRTAKEDPDYTDINGHHHRHYTLSSFVAPRNLGLGN
jgi:type IV pilus assembly protein PilW